MDLHLVKIACERPDEVGRSLSHWTCRELAGQLVAAHLTKSISPATVRRKLSKLRLKPWRFHLWLSPKVPRDANFAALVRQRSSLYSRMLAPDERVLCLDEKTSLQPRPRLNPTRPARPEQSNLVEAEYKRVGALNLFAAFDTRSGRVYARTAPRKRQVEFIAFLQQLDQTIDPDIQCIHLVMDNVRMHKGKLVQDWLEAHPRFRCYFPPVHCSWMNQVEQWFSILQRQRFRVADFESIEALAAALQAFVAQWNVKAHSFKWQAASFDKVLAKCEAETLKAVA